MYIQKVTTLKELHDVYRLTYCRYLDEKYCDEKLSGLYIHYPMLDCIPETVTFMAIDEDKIVGCNSITFDNEYGFHVDEDFPAESKLIKDYCKENDLNLAASWRIVTLQQDPKSTLKIFNLLVKTTIQEGTDHKVDICMFTFNPHHVAYYEKMLNLDIVATGVCKKANYAPSVLMRGEYSKIVNSKFWLREKAKP